MNEASYFIIKKLFFIALASRYIAWQAEGTWKFRVKTLPFSTFYVRIEPTTVAFTVARLIPCAKTAAFSIFMFLYLKFE